MMQSGMIVWIRKRREQRLIFVYLISCPVKVRNFKLRLLGQRDLAGKADRTTLELAFRRQIGRRSSTLQPGVVVAEDDTPATEVGRVCSIRFLFRVIEKPQHPTLWQRSTRIVWMYHVEIHLGNKRLWHALQIRPGETRRYIRNSTNPGCPD